MELYVDSADPSHVRSVAELGVLDGVTTNPSLIARERRGFEEIIRELDGVVDGRVWCEVIATDAGGMVEEAMTMQGWAAQPVVKVPMGAEGIKAVSRLSRQGIETNVTLVYSVPQALLAAKAGASWVSPYAGRIDDLGVSGVGLIRDIVEVFAVQRLPTRVLAASIRGPRHVAELARAGVHGMTMPYEVLLSLTRHPATDVGLDAFLKDWSEAGLDAGDALANERQA
jgi:transaldolase